MDEIFKNNPDLHEYYETSDGQKFYTENLARNHARSLDKNEVQHVTRNGGEEQEVKPLKAADIIAQAPEMDLDTACDYLDAELALEKPRKTVVEALKNRITEIENGN